MGGPSSKMRFSIVIPAYNEQDYLVDTLRSLQNQTYSGEYEIIVVDNNSTDSTYQVADSLGVNVIKEPSVGVCWARQSGTKIAKGEIVVSTDADTMHDPNWLKNIDKLFKNNPDSIAIVGNCVFLDPPYWAKVYPKLLFGAMHLIYRISGKTYYGSATNIAFYKSAWSGYETNISQGGDELGVIRSLRKVGKVVFTLDNPTTTSSRRLTRGFFYNIIVTFLIYYILEYNLSRIFKRPILGPCPKFRENSWRHNSLSTRFSQLLREPNLDKPPIE